MVKTDRLRMRYIDSGPENGVPVMMIHVQFEMFEGSGHGPLFDAADRWSKVFFTFLASVEGGANAGAARTAV
jgi:hypothetical protein